MFSPASSCPCCKFIAQLHSIKLKFKNYFHYCEHRFSSLFLFVFSSIRDAHTHTRKPPMLPRATELNFTKPEVKKHLWHKMRVILQQIYRFRDQYEYFYKADDDTFAVVENLKRVLRKHNPDRPFMTGHRWQLKIPGGYFSGGAGYVLSREALKRIVEKAIFKHPQCPNTDEAMEDVKMSICGNAVGVERIDSLDERGESLFCPFDMKYPFDHYKPEPVSTNPNSDRQISFHYVTPFMMYLIEFLVYYLKPAGMEIYDDEIAMDNCGSIGCLRSTFR
ncbi:unnamed protein product [Echinostoma caproni]|uniref:N-acetylgalactosaminide beta-1,3-galactosyltransferase n=1 Tax=Echinostoma caproni TaxID=27848 RepID=A0A183A741_9TREM|nr:unnamed protein product [Echinostoma caproni]